VRQASALQTGSQWATCINGAQLAFHCNFPMSAEGKGPLLTEQHNPMRKFNGRAPGIKDDSSLELQVCPRVVGALQVMHAEMRPAVAG
jgi:hypothetical protein